MKKLFFALIAMMAIVFTGCKTETSTVTVAVEDYNGAPVDKCPIVYADYASIILDAVAPDPTSLAFDTEDCWEYAETNAQGTVVLQIPLSVSKIKFRFMAYDRGSSKWVEKDVELHRGVNADVNFVVNK